MKKLNKHTKHDLFRVVPQNRYKHFFPSIFLSSLFPVFPSLEVILFVSNRVSNSSSVLQIYWRSYYRLWIDLLGNTKLNHYLHPFIWLSNSHNKFWNFFNNIHKSLSLIFNAYELCDFSNKYRPTHNAV